MIEYQELIARHQALQKQLADQPDAMDIQRVRRLVAQAQDAGEHIGDPQQREQLRAILRHWGAFIYERTGDLLATQLAPHGAQDEPQGDRKRIFSPSMRASSLWLLGALITVIVIATVAIKWGNSLLITLTPAPTPTETPIGHTETATATPTAAPQTTVYLAPELVNLKVGETATVSVRVDSARRLNSVYLQMGFDPNFVTVEDTGAEIDGIQITPGKIPKPVEIARNEVTTDTDGRIIYQAAQEPGTGADGSGVIASIVLRGVVEGGSTLLFEELALYDDDGKAIQITKPSDGLIAIATAGMVLTSTPTLTPTPETPITGPIDPSGDVGIYASGASIEAPPEGVDIRTVSARANLSVVLQPTEGIPPELAGWATEDEILLWIALYDPVPNPPPYTTWQFVLDLDGNRDTGREGDRRINPDLGYEAAIGILYSPSQEQYEPFFLVWDPEQEDLIRRSEMPRYTLDESRTLVGLAFSLETLRQTVSQITGVTLAPEAVKGRAAVDSYAGEERVIDFCPDLPE
jgi:hypothetical protein